MSDETLTLSLEDLDCGVVTAPQEFWTDLQQAVNELVQKLTQVAQEVQNMLPGFPRPAEIDTWLGELSALNKLVRPGGSAIPKVVWPGNPQALPPALLKLAVRLKLGQLHEHDEVLRQKAHASEFVDRVRQRIVDLSSTLQWPPVRTAAILRLPVATDFVTLAAAQARSPLEEAPQFRYDDKFGILRSPTCFAKDFVWVRSQSSIRGRPFTVAYADIDRFKALNKELTESVVDRDVLPAFMRTIEGYCFHRAMAYREGGDEYLFLLPNQGAEDARAFLKGLQRELASVQYPELVPRRPAISVGFHVLAPDDPETTFQARTLANRAKNRAKARRGSIRQTTEDEREEMLGLVGAGTGQSPISSRVVVKV